MDNGVVSGRHGDHAVLEFVTGAPLSRHRVAPWCQDDAHRSGSACPVLVSGYAAVALAGHERTAAVGIGRACGNRDQYARETGSSHAWPQRDERDDSDDE